MKPIERVMRGMRWSPKYGSHPGTPWLLFFIVLGGLAGSYRESIAGIALGAVVMAAIYGPIYLWGCWETGGDDAWNQDDRDLRRPQR